MYVCLLGELGDGRSSATNAGASDICGLRDNPAFSKVCSRQQRASTEQG